MKKVERKETEKKTRVTVNKLFQSVGAKKLTIRDCNVVCKHVVNIDRQERQEGHAVLRAEY